MGSDFRVKGLESYVWFWERACLCLVGNEIEAKIQTTTYDLGSGYEVGLWVSGLKRRGDLGLGGLRGWLRGSGFWPLDEAFLRLEVKDLGSGLRAWSGVFEGWRIVGSIALGLRA